MSHSTPATARPRSCAAARSGSPFSCSGTGSCWRRCSLMRRVGQRVLILSWEYPPIVEGGLARHVRKLSEELVRAGAEVHVLTRGGGHRPPEEDRHGVIVHRVKEPDFPKDDLDAFIAWVGRMNRDMARAGEKLGERLEFDVVHSHDWLVAPAAERLKKRFGA